MSEGSRQLTPDPVSSRAIALGIGLSLAAAALLAHLGRVAETPAGSAYLDMIGPGKIGRLRALELDTGGQPPAGTDALARQALAATPLAYEPHFAVAAAAVRGKPEAGSEREARLVREALRRNPRSRESHVFLFRQSLATGQISRAIDQLAVLNQLNSGVRESLMPAFGRAISSEKQVDEAVASLKPHPELFEPFVWGFSKASRPRALTLSLIGRLPKSTLAEPKIRDLAVKELIRVQAFAEARRLWGAQQNKDSMVHSPDFADRSSPPPFNWTMVADASGAVEYDKRGGVIVNYYGRTPAPLISQLVTLAPGSYKARLHYRTEAGTPGSTVLRLACAGQAVVLFEQPLTGAIEKEQVLSVAFALPGNACPGQTLSIAGRVQESRDPQAILVRKLDMIKDGGR